MPNQAAGSTGGGHKIGGTTAILLTTALAIAQPGRPDLSQLTVLRDLEYIPGGHGGFKDPQVETIVAEFFNKHLRR